ncbi:hypothetical protein CERZMDRAFT_95716 [Cercospora zeae-maydis SCOH1-5]|uniref:HIT-type domain-containing protein n=1 Tax=Cercospora zeae-maydis SCOH1-5 TaxID=717836 RepID=A0A6A6FM79_9PEZI|nr:hypothetical protein CERZMDRAFT_95716 [Cercospora zeae-maydis SCOH1-5]
MATPGLRFRTPYIEELPLGQQRQAPGFAWVSIAGPVADPAKNWGTTNKKRARGPGAGGQTEAQKEALSAKQQRQVERKIRELNNDGMRDVQIPAPKGEVAKGGGYRVGKTPATKKILASGKTFQHYLDDEEAEIALKGKRDLDNLPGPKPDSQRASKTPIARRKLSNLQKEEGSASGSPAPNVNAPPVPTTLAPPMPSDLVDLDEEDDETLDPLPTQAEMEALLNAPPLTYNQARSAPPPANAPPPRQFCETCGYWGRVKCMKCGNMTCSVLCKDTHDEHKCLKFYA